MCKYLINCDILTIITPGQYLIINTLIETVYQDMYRTNKRKKTYKE